jgi:hypothetical protein
LFGAAVFSTTEPARRVSLAELETFIRRTGRLCVSPRTAGAAPDGRPVLLEEEATLVESALRRPGLRVPYVRAVETPSARATREARRPQDLRAIVDADRDGWPAGEPRPMVPFASSARRGIVGVRFARGTSRLRRTHAGVAIDEVTYGERVAPVMVVVDDDAIVPSAEWDGVEWPRNEAYAFVAKIERALFDRVVAALGGANAKDGSEGAELANAPRLEHVGDGLRGWLLTAARSSLDAKRKEAVRALPLLSTCDATGMPEAISLAAIAQHHEPGAKVPILSQPPNFATLDWRPLVVRGPDERAALLRPLAKGENRSDAVIGYEVDAAELERRRDLAVIEGARLALLSGPAHVETLTEPDRPSVTLEPATEVPNDMRVRVGITHARSAMTILFETEGTARLVGRRALPIDLPLGDVVVTVRDSSHLSSWRELSDAGIARLRDRLLEAAQMLCESILPARGFFDDLPSLRLVRGLLGADLSAMVPAARAEARKNVSRLKALLRSRTVKWPTIQGGSCRFGGLARATGGAMLFGRNRYPSWIENKRAEAELDRHVLHVPETAEGAMLAALLGELLVLPLEDVTEQAAKLQQRRAARRAQRGEVAAALPPLALDGAPTHPALRATLESLEVRDEDGPVAGELELVAGPLSEVRVVGLGGAVAEARPVLLPPIRLIARVVETDAGTEALAPFVAAARRLLASLGPRLDAFPSFVADMGRALACATASGPRTVAVERLHVFPDVAGAMHTLGALREGAWSFTTDPPPYPSVSRNAPVLRLAEGEAKSLGTGGVTLADVTAQLREERVGEARATAPPLAVVGLDPTLRAGCLRVFGVNEPGLRGEIGHLSPDEGRRRGIAAHTTRRPLCALADDVGGWPLVAALDDDGLAPNARFDGPAREEDAKKLVARARTLADSDLAAWLAPPPDARSVRRLDFRPAEVEPAFAGRDLRLAGVVWLPREWPRDPSIAISGPSVNLSTYRPSAPCASRRWHAPHTRVLPLGGLVLVTLPAGAATRPLMRDDLAFVDRILFEHAKAMIAELARGTSDAPEVELYRWNLRLLEAEADGDVRVESADGADASAAEVRATLEERGELWWIGRDGAMVGEWPDGTPRPILIERGRGAALIEVLRHRAAPGVLREIGGIGTSAPERAIDPVPSPFAPPAARGNAASPWCDAIRTALHALQLTGEPVGEVGVAQMPRPMKYVVETRQLLVDPEHASVRVAMTAPGGRGLAALVACAVAEINRALVKVTDAEESRALAQLLRARPR